MPAFDFSGIGMKAKASKDYGFLIDQLDIKRNQLESDGKLSPGDYDLLIGQGRQIFSHPGLSPAQRSTMLVKISQYEQEKKTSVLKTANDIPRINNELKDDFAKNAMFFGNNPQLLLRANEDAVRLKVAQLSQSIDALNNAGDDASAHLNEFRETLNLFNDFSQARDDVKNYQPGGKPTSNFVAYVTTNSSGEIVNMEVGRTGSKTGFAETNGLYGGLQIYGKVNRKEFGKNIFVLGNNTFSGSDLTVQDPTTPGAFRSAPLLSEDTKGGRNIGLVINTYKDVDLNFVMTQGAIRTGGWAEGGSGFLYKKLPSGQYQKYINTSKEQLEISDNDIIRIPKAMEQGLLPNVIETIDGLKPFIPPISPAATSTPVAPAMPAGPAAPAPSPLPTGTSRTPSPTVRSPQTIGGYAEKALNVGKGILQYLFRGGE